MPETVQRYLIRQLMIRRAETNIVSCSTGTVASHRKAGTGLGKDSGTVVFLWLFWSSECFRVAGDLWSEPTALCSMLASYTAN